MNAGGTSERFTRLSERAEKRSPAVSTPSFGSFASFFAGAGNSNCRLATRAMQASGAHSLRFVRCGEVDVYAQGCSCVCAYILTGLSQSGRGPKIAALMKTDEDGLGVSAPSLPFLAKPFFSPGFERNALTEDPGREKNCTRLQQQCTYTRRFHLTPWNRRAMDTRVG